MTIEEIIAPDKRNITEIITDLKAKSVTVPAWGGKNGLAAQYYPEKHPVMDKSLYPDIVTDGRLEPVTRITYDLQRLAVKRMVELCNGIPPKRIYRPENDMQKEIADYMERLYQRNRIDSVNVDRCTMLFASCEVMTLWYATEEPNNYYGFNSPLKIRCRSFSPMLGDDLYPLFDEYGDMIAMSVEYSRKVAAKKMTFFDVYTADNHYRFSGGSGGWRLETVEEIKLAKIPASYTWRPTPIWEDTSKSVYEMEWAMSRNGNYLRKNSKPLFVLFADETISYGNEKSETEEARSILQFPKGSSASYVTWAQAIDNLKFYISELRQSFFTQLQLPDWNYEKMSQMALSGESRKQLFIDAQMKVKDESGRLLEFFDREVNVVKAFMKAALGEAYHKDIDALQVETVITPYTINDEAETIKNLTTANGGKPIISQRESIEEYGHSSDVDQTMKEIQEENQADAFELSV